MELMNKKIIIIAVVLSLITSFFIYAYIQKSANISVKSPKISVYVASKDLPERTKITLSDMNLVQIEESALQANAIKSKDEIIDKRVKFKIFAGEQFREDRIEEEKNMSMAYKIPYGKRALSFNINESSAVGYNIKPGDYVDVVGTFDKEETLEGTQKVFYQKITKIVLQNIQVLGVGALKEDTPKTASTEEPKTITLAVDLKDTEKLIYALESSTIKIILRPVDDKTSINTNGAIRLEVTGKK